MTRIVAGVAKGRTVQVPPQGTRPTSERVREALFSRLEAMGLLDSTLVWDLFAGSGALGLEAASRGASRVICVEKARVAAQVIQRNIATSGLGQVVEVDQGDALAFVQRWVGPPVDLVLLDPPYDFPDDDLAQILAALVPHLVADALVVVERSSRSAEPHWPAPGVDVGDNDKAAQASQIKARTTSVSGLLVEGQRTYGDTVLWFAGPPSQEADV